VSEVPKPEPEAVAHPYFAYILGSVVLFALVTSPLIDYLAGDWKGYGKAALKGVFMGLFFGLVMYPFERWLKRREARKKAAEKAKESP
jgi:hypothetical protein